MFTQKITTFTGYRLSFIKICIKKEIKSEEFIENEYEILYFGNKNDICEITKLLCSGSSVKLNLKFFIPVIQECPVVRRVAKKLFKFLQHKFTF